MIINHNMNAMNANRNMGINNNATAKSMEKLSSGLRINRAGDDAAGLAISEKMRGQIRGLDQASRNAQDGISLIQTAEGALNETTNILQRMRELSVQSANDTNVSVDRAAIQEEMKALTEEVDRIAKDTEFNTQNLLDGSFSGKLQIGANGGQNMNIKIDAMNANSLGLTGGITLVKDKDIIAGKLADGTYTIGAANAIVDANGNQVAKVDTNTIKNANNETVVDLTADKKIEFKEGSTITIKDGKMTINSAKTDTKLSSGNYEISGKNVLRDGELVGELDKDPGSNPTKITLSNGGGEVVLTELGLVGGKLANGDSFTIHGIDASTQEKASASIETVNTAIEKVSTQRAQLGAIQNRLEHTTANLDNTSENLQSAESRVRDVDMAKEMMTFSKNNILQQAAQSMLAQANQQPQGVLSLLQ